MKKKPEGENKKSNREIDREELLQKIMESKQNTDMVTPEWIESRIKEKNLNKKTLAALVGVSPSQLSQWLGGVRNPSKTAKLAIYNVLK